MTIYIAPNCPPEVEKMIREKHRGEVILGRSLVALGPRAADEKTTAERKWKAAKQPSKPQAQCDLGLFSDERNQLDLF